MGLYSICSRFQSHVVALIDFITHKISVISHIIIINKERRMNEHNEEHDEDQPILSTLSLQVKIAIAKQNNLIS